MAEDNMDQPTDEGTDTTPEVMDKGESTNLSQTAECIQNYIKDPLEGEIKLATSEETIACIDYKGKLSDQEYKYCNLVKIKAIHHEYFGIKNTVSTNFFKQTSLIDEEVDSVLEKNTAVSAALDSTLNAIKEAKTKLWAVREAACKLDGARNDSCNSEQLSAMGKIPAGDPDGKSGVARFQALVDDLKNQAYALYDEVDDVFEKGVKVAGVQAYMNTSSLKDFSSALKDDASKFSEDVNGNITYAEEKIAEVQTAYTEGLESLDTSMYAKSTAHLEHLSLEAMEDYANNLEAQQCEDATSSAGKLEDICENIKAVFKDQINCGPKPE